jgi:hypothetical protein
MTKALRRKINFAVCVSNDGYEASLEAGKLYRVIPDAAAEAHGYVRVIDESGEDYGYSADRFFRLDIPAALAQALTPGRVQRRAGSRSKGT